MSEPIEKIGMIPPHPGAFIREEVIEPLELTVASAADALRVHRSQVSDLMDGKVPLSPEMALRVEKAFGVSMDTLLRMQAWFDAHAMRERSNEINVPRFKASNGLTRSG
jgi:addiction module HigA family antidote